MKSVFLIFSAILWTLNTSACLNEYGHAMDGSEVRLRYLSLVDDGEVLRKNAKKRLEELRIKLEGNDTGFKIWSDIAVNLMKIGKIDSSLKILQPLVKENPYEYELLANIGTAYELSGNLDSALKYISKGYENNPYSHKSSEWIHVKILEGKLMEKKRPGWLDTHSIITKEELNTILQEDKDKDELVSVERVSRQVFYQVRTRVPFTPAPNKVIANLLQSIGEWNSEKGTFENALLSLGYALKFQPHHDIQRRLKEKIKRLNKKRRRLGIPVPDFIFGLVQRAEINPELFLLGLDDFAFMMDSIATQREVYEDSMLVLQTEMDSIGNVNIMLVKQNANYSDTIEVKDRTISKESFVKYLYLAFGLLLGLVFYYILFRMKGR